MQTMQMNINGHARSGFSLTELMVVTVAGAVVLAAALPALGRLRSLSMTEESLANLATLGMAHQSYAADWNGRQMTLVVDDISLFGNSPIQAVQNYQSFNGMSHPGILLGWAEVGGNFGLFGYYMSNAGNNGLVQPIDLDYGFGWFRMPNVKAFHGYIDGRFFSPAFYAPADTVPFALAETAFDGVDEFQAVIGTSDLVWSSYCLSPAALFSPDVLRSPFLGGFQDPWSLSDGFACPPITAPLFPDLKTHMMEHHWLQGPPAVCNPAVENGTYDGCEPFYFNQGITSSPGTLFYDGHARLLPNQEVQMYDELLISVNGEGLWSRDTPFGSAGYFQELAFDLVVDVSHHILTTDGIFGRDTFGPMTGAVTRSTATPASRPRAVDTEQLDGDAATTYSLPDHEFLIEAWMP